MNTMTTTGTGQTNYVAVDDYQITGTAGSYTVTKNGTYLTNRKGEVRVFTSLSGARKHITREKRGNFHK